MKKNSSAPTDIWALSRIHAEHPYVFNVGDQDYRVGYPPWIILQSYELHPCPSLYQINTRV
jgi:hypothetical protein